MNVLLIYPPYPYESVSTFEEPLGVLYLASSLRSAGHRVSVADFTFDPGLAGLAEAVRRAEVVGISVSTPLFAAAQRVLRHVRAANPHVFTVAGGPHVTARPTDALDAGFDAAVIGEGEETAKELIAAIGGNTALSAVPGISFRQGSEVVTTPARAFIPHLDEVPFPARDLIDYSRYRRIGVISMRGCPYRCIYCKPVEDVLFGRKLRRRSPEHLAEEIAAAVKLLGRRPVSFKDDTLTVNRAEWFVRLAEELSRRRSSVTWQCSGRVDSVDLPKLKAMKGAGCRQIFFGIESGSQRILDYYRKDVRVDQTRAAFALCRRAGIRACASIMIGAPIESRDDLEETYRLVRAIKPFNWHVHVTTPICGSYLFDEARAQDRLISPDDFTTSIPTGNIYRLAMPMRLDHLTRADIAEFRDRINSYMKFRLLLNCLRDPRIWKELLRSRGFRIIAVNFLRRHFRLPIHGAPRVAERTAP